MTGERERCFWWLELTVSVYSSRESYSVVGGALTVSMSVAVKRKSAFAQAPKSEFLQRSLQKGRTGLLGA